MRRPKLPVLDALETRTAMAAPPGSFFVIEDQVAASTGPETFELNLPRAAFLAPGGRVTVVVVAEDASEDGSLDPAAPTFSRRGVSVLTRRDDTYNVSDRTDAIAIARLAPGQHRLRLDAEPGTGGPIWARIALAGDVDGNYRVTRSDVEQIRQALGGRSDGPGFVAAADVNQDGFITRYDLELARTNLGAATALRPLAIDAKLDESVDPDGDGVTDSANALVVGTGRKGTLISVEGRGISTRIGADGTYELTVPIQPGVNELRLLATDRFGQSIGAPFRPIRTTGAEATLTTDFRNGAQGWTGGASDYAPATDPDGTLFDIEMGIAPLPQEVGPGTGFLLKGSNRSDDLFLFLKRQLTQADGVRANQGYLLRFDITYATNAPTGAVGIGGPPGEAVYLKAGGSAVEPVAVPQPEGDLRMNIDKGNQSTGGRDASVVGDLANGTDEFRYVSITKRHTHQTVVRSSATGDLWTIVGIDSGFEGTTELFIQQVVVTLIPV